MIDDPATVADLMKRLEAALPMPARLTPELRAALRGQQIGSVIPADGTITLLHYLGDQAGILCKLDLGPDIQNAAFVSITHLHFDPRLELTRAIAAYQKHRVRRLRRRPA